MEIVVQHPLFPDVRPTWWLYVPVDTWEYKSEDVVKRATENAACKRIYREAKLVKQAGGLLYTDMHSRVHQLELHYMRRNPHYKEPDVQEAIAVDLHMTASRVKKILAHIEKVFEIYALLGIEHLLN